MRRGADIRREPASANPWLRRVGSAGWLAAIGLAGYFSFKEPSRAHADRPTIAHVVKYLGGVETRPDDSVNWSPVLPGQDVAELDHLATEAHAAATLALDSGRRLDVGPDTHIIIERDDTALGQRVNFTVTLLRGELRIAAGSGGGRPFPGLTIKTRQSIFYLDQPSSELGLQAERQGAVRVLSRRDVRTESIAGSERVAATNIERQASEATPMVKPAAAPAALRLASPAHATQAPSPREAPAPRLALAAIGPPRIEVPLGGTTLWAGPEGLRAKSIAVSVSTAGAAPTAARLVVSVYDASSGRLLRKIEGHGTARRQDLQLALGDVAVAAGPSPGALRLEPALEPLQEGAPVLRGKPVLLQLNTLRGDEPGHYLATFGARPPWPAPPGTIAVAAGSTASSGHGATLEVFGGAMMGRLFPWLASQPNVAVAPGTRSGSKAVYFLRDRQVLAIGWEFGGMAAAVPEIARRVGATVAVEAESDALPRAGTLSVPAPELKPMLAAWPALRFFVVQDGHVKTFSPELVLRDTKALETLATSGLGPFRKPIAVLYASKGAP